MKPRVVVAALLLLALAVSALVGRHNWLFLMTGLGMGYLVQASRFCMLGAASDLVLLRQGNAARAVVLLLALTLPGFALVQFIAGVGGCVVEGYVLPAGAGTVLGGLCFGAGMVLAGGCLLSTLARAGEGMASAWLALLGLTAGSTLGAWHYGWWQQWLPGKAVFLPSGLGWLPALGLEGLALLLLWQATRYREGKCRGGIER